MTTLFHHTRKDIRQHRALIGIWLILLAADALMSCTTLVKPSLTEIASMVLVALAAGLPLAFGWSDPVALGDHFLATRPVPARQLWGSKALTLVLVILLPLLIQAGIVTAWLGLGATHAKMLCAERLLLAVPAVAIMLCIGGLEPIRLGLAAIIGPALGCLLAALGLGLACHFRDITPNQTSLLYALYVMAAAMSLMLWRQSGRPRSLKRNLAIYGGGALALFLLQSRGPLDLFPVRPPPESSVPELSVAMGTVSHTGRSGEVDMVRVVPRVEDLPEAWFAVPTATGARFGTTTFTPDPRRLARIRRMVRWRGSSKAGERVLADLCDVDVLYTDMNAREAAVTTRWPRNTFDQQADLEVDLELGLFSYEAIAPPTRVRLSERVRASSWFWCELRTPQFRFSRDLATRQQRLRELPRSFAFVLVHKPSRRGVLCDAGSARTRGSWSGLPQLNLRLTARALELWPAESLDEFELRVFRRVYKGRTTPTIREPDFGLDSLEHYSHRDTIDVREHDRLLSSIAKDDSAALLDLIGRTNHNFSLWEPAPQQLRAIGERDFGELLSHWPGDSNNGQRVLSMVVEDLLDDTNKAALLAALPEHPDLACLAVSRGWGAEIREPLLALLAGRRNVPLRTFQALLLLDDPSVHPAILADFAEAPTLYLFTLLERVPALRLELDRIAREFWQRHRRTIDINRHMWYQDALQLGLRVGDPGAVALVAACLATPQGRAEHGSNMVSALRPVLLLPRNKERAIEVLAAGNFRYDSERRIYLEAAP